jgi:mediator of RNA polymerase II transcription subunit 7
MADQQRPLPNAPFPAPPPFWKHFTTENIAKLKAIDDALEDSKHSEPILPLELQYLRPPSPPAENYTIFGENQTVCLSLRNPYKESLLTSITQLSANLPSLGDLQLFPEPLPSGGHAYYLTKITKSILLNFLELTTILSADPSAATPKLEDIRRLFLNAHHLINMYRPHQARETLIMMMEEQLEEGRREMEECERVRGKVEESLKAMEGLGLNAEGSGVRGVNGVVKNTKAKEMDDTQSLWQMIHEMDPD